MLTQKRIVITGAGSGIGRATSKLAAGYGAQVVCVDLTDSVEDTVTEITQAGGTAIAVQADVSDEANVISFVEKCVSEYGGIDGIYANAGVSGGRKTLTELTVEDWQRTLAVNTIGVFFGGQTHRATFCPTRWRRHCLYRISCCSESQCWRRRLFSE